MRKHEDGFTVAEVLISLAILLIVVMGVLTALEYSAWTTQQNAMRQGAVELANKTLEKARTIPYAELGTHYPDGTYGDPPGSIPTSTTVGDYTVVTSVSWVRDPVSHRATYKDVQVTVSWQKPHASSVFVETGVFGKNSYVNSGDVQIHVLDADDLSAQIAGAAVTLTPATGVTRWETTLTDGIAFFGYVPSGATGVAAALTGWMADLTAFGAKTVNTDSLNDWALLMQRESDATIYVVGAPSGSPIAGATVTLTNNERSLIYYGTSNAAGAVTFPQLWKATGAGYTVLVTYPGRDNGVASFTIPSGGYHASQTVTINDPTSFVVSVKDAATNAVVAGAQVTVRDSVNAHVPGSPGVTSAGGTASFQINQTGTYTVTVAATGYTTSVTSTNISAGVGAVTYMVALAPPTYLRVTCKDSVSNLPIAGASVTVGSTTLTTDSSGNALFTITATGTYAINATASGYQGYSGSQYVALGSGTVAHSASMVPAPTTGSLRVHVTRWWDGDPRDDVQVTLYRGNTQVATQRTDSDGYTTFTNLAPGTNYRVRRTNYNTYFGYFTVTAGLTTTAEVSW
ncbi:MAG: hypothetical protein HGA39_07010 [Coriobacteriia bacterium]|nr:hypothetical protein [Coriobacteriia bacterium]